MDAIHRELEEARVNLNAFSGGSELPLAPHVLLNEGLLVVTANEAAVDVHGETALLALNFDLGHGPPHLNSFVLGVDFFAVGIVELNSHTELVSLNVPYFGEVAAVSIGEEQLASWLLLNTAELLEVFRALPLVGDALVRPLGCESLNTAATRVNNESFAEGHLLEVGLERRHVRVVVLGGCERHLVEQVLPDEVALRLNLCVFPLGSDDDADLAVKRQIALLFSAERYFHFHTTAGSRCVITSLFFNSLFFSSWLISSRLFNSLFGFLESSSVDGFEVKDRLLN